MVKARRSSRARGAACNSATLATLVGVGHALVVHIIPTAAELGRILHAVLESMNRSKCPTVATLDGPCAYTGQKGVREPRESGASKRKLHQGLTCSYRRHVGVRDARACSAIRSKSFRTRA